MFSPQQATIYGTAGKLVKLEKHIKCTNWPFLGPLWKGGEGGRDVHSVQGLNFAVCPATPTPTFIRFLCRKS